MENPDIEWMAWLTSLALKDLIKYPGIMLYIDRRTLIDAYWALEDKVKAIGEDFYED